MERPIEFLPAGARSSVLARMFEGTRSIRSFATRAERDFATMRARVPIDPADGVAGGAGDST